MPLVTLLDAEQRILARGRSFGSWPATLDYQAADAVELLIVVHDAIFFGGPEYPYALEFTLGNTSPRAQNGTRSGVAAKSETRHQSYCQSRAHGNFIVGTDDRGQCTKQSTSSAQPGGVFPADRSACSHDFEAVKDQQLAIEVTSHSAQQLTDPRFVIYRLLPAKESTPVAEGTAKGTVEGTAAGSSEVNFTLQQLLEQDDPPADWEMLVCTFAAVTH